jgi:RimJ/RimL family protein N-acetyltransferase
MSLQLSGDRLGMRELTREDLPQVLEIYNSNPAYNLMRNGTDTYTLSELDAEYNAVLSIPNGHWLTLSTKDGLIGVMHVTISDHPDQKSWINLLLLHADHQQKGLGREAVRLVEEFCLSAGIVHLHHGVIAHNEPALLFWGKLGYEQYRQVTAPVGRLVQPVLLVAKWLQSTE